MKKKFKLRLIISLLLISSIVICLIGVGSLYYQMQSSSFIIAEAGEQYDMYIHKKWVRSSVMYDDKDLYISYFFYPWLKGDIISPLMTDNVQYRGLGAGILLKFQEGTLVRAVGVSDESQDGIFFFNLDGSAKLKDQKVTKISFAGEGADGTKYQYKLPNLKLEEAEPFSNFDKSVLEHADALGEDESINVSQEEWSIKIEGNEKI